MILRTEKPRSIFVIMYYLEVYNVSTTIITTSSSLDVELKSFPLKLGCLKFFKANQTLF